MADDKLRFFRAWMANPMRVAAIAPSGAALARLMVHDIVPSDGPIIELGPGTGVFTQALLDRGIAESDLVLVEKEPEFAAILNHRFPAATILCGDATRLNRAELDRLPSPAAVVSGLPLLSMPQRHIMAILTGSFAQMRTGGRFYQFTYGPRCPVPRPVLNRLDLKASQIGRTIRNIPPAAVYRLMERHPATDKLRALAVDPHTGKSDGRPAAD